MSLLLHLLLYLPSLRDNSELSGCEIMNSVAALLCLVDCRLPSKAGLFPEGSLVLLSVA